ncbi:MAG: hypothetical protein QOK49_2906 [Baekduia sp.]|nr:hypothetical protein [Baekduia sp.]
MLAIDAVPGPIAAVAAAPAATVTCADKSEGAFRAPSARHDVLLGPLTFVGAADAATESLAQLRRFGDRWKVPLLVRPGHRVVVSVRPSSRAAVRLDYLQPHSATPEPVALARLPARMTFVACADGATAGSSAGHTPVTFWSGSIAFRRVPACVRLDVRVDGGPLRHRSFGLGDHRCATR